MLRLTHDEEADAVYVYLTDESYDHGRQLDDRRRIDFAANGSVRGIELLYVSDGVDVTGLPEQERLGRLLEEHSIKVLAA